LQIHADYSSTGLARDLPNPSPEITQNPFHALIIGDQKTAQVLSLTQAKRSFKKHFVIESSLPLLPPTWHIMAFGKFFP
jgi:hypothetical protein